MLKRNLQQASSVEEHFCLRLAEAFSAFVLEKEHLLSEVKAWEGFAFSIVTSFLQSLGDLSKAFFE